MKHLAIIALDHACASDTRHIHLASHPGHGTKHVDRYADAEPSPMATMLLASYLYCE